MRFISYTAFGTYPSQQIIVTSYLFPGGRFDESRLKSLSALVGAERLVVDVSCRRRGNGWVVATDKWRTLSDLDVNKGSLSEARASTTSDSC